MKKRKTMFPADANLLKLDDLAFTHESTYSKHDRFRHPTEESTKFQPSNISANVITNKKIGKLICKDWSCSICRNEEKFEPKKFD